MRLTADNWQYRNLNPYYVLQLGTDATEEDIKNRYRKLSAKVHPDKNRGVENARDSFEEVKKAYNKLRPTATKHISAAMPRIADLVNKHIG